jgi:hypothetical protein
MMKIWLNVSETEKSFFQVLGLADLLQVFQNGTFPLSSYKQLIYDKL